MIGKKISINLSDHTWVQDEILPADVRNCGGGTGLALQAFREGATGAGQNRVVIAPGLLAGTNAPAGQWSAAVFYDSAKRQITVSYFGGHWGASLKHAGIGLLEIEGTAPALTVLVLENDRVQFQEAGELAGLSPRETCRRLEASLGEGYRMASIGLAGEKGIPLASLVFDESYQRQSAGLGAQLGQMRLKALAVKGTGKVVPLSPDDFSQEAKNLRTRFGQGLFPYRELSSYGPAWFLRELHEQGMLPLKNFATGFLPEWKAVSGESLADSFIRQPVACCGCPVGCRSRILKNGTWMESPGLEEIIALSLMCGIADIKEIVEMKSRCDHLGIDPLALGDSGFMSTDTRAGLHLALQRVTWPLEEPHILGSDVFLTRLPVYAGSGKTMEAAKAVTAYQDLYLGLQCLGFCPWTALLFTPGDLDSLLQAALGEGLPKEATAHFGRAVRKSGTVSLCEQGNI